MKCKKSTRIISLLLTLIMVIGLMAVLVPGQNVEASEGASWLDGYQVISVNDEGTNTLGDEHFAGTAADDGKVWVDKTVSSGTIYGATAGDKNFNVVLSAVAQSYSTPNIEFTTYKREVAYDVVLVLDTSSSMVNDRLEIMADAVNATIRELMQNENNRVAIVVYPTESTQTTGQEPYEYKAGTFLPMGHYYTDDIDGNYISTNTDDEVTVTNQYIELCTTTTGDEAFSQVYTKSNEDKNYLTNTKQKVHKGTPTQLGLNEAYMEFERAIKNEKPAVGSVPRVPATILLTDGKPVRSWENYNEITNVGIGGPKGAQGYQDGVLGKHTFAYDTDEIEERGANSTVAYNTIMTANHVKRKIQALYNDKYNGNGLDLYEKAITDYKESSIGQMFTIGMEIGQYEWASYVMDPTNDELGSEWANTSVPRIQQKLREGEYKDNYSYSDKYLRGEGLTADDLTAMFKEILGDMVQETNDYTVHNPIDSEGSVLADTQNVTFEDYLGYKMELKGDKQYVRYNSVNYTFCVTDATKDSNVEKEYTWDGTDISGKHVASPAVFVQEKKEDGTVQERAFSLYDIKLTAEKDNETEVNDQKGYWKVTWTIPSPLLPTYDREEGFSTTRPIRMLCEVGLEEDTNPIEDALKITASGTMASTEDDIDKYAFYTNLYDFEKGEEYSTVNFKPAADNPYYYKTGYTTEKPSSDDAKKYVEVDFITNRTQNLTVSGEASEIKLENLRYDVDGGNRNFSFTYNGKTYSGDLSSIEAVEDGLNRYSGTVDIPVTWKYDVVTEVESKAAVKIIIGAGEDSEPVLRTLTVNDKVYSSTENATYIFDSVPVSGVGGTTEGKVLTTTYAELHHGKYTDIDGNEKEGYYIEDALNHKIKVEVTLDGNDEASCTINLGGEAQKSDIYYKVENERSYPEAGKDFYKGHEAKVYDSSVVIGLNEENKPVGTYYPSEKNNEAADSYGLEIEKLKHSGVDDYYKATASLTSPAGQPMEMKFIFRLIKVGDKYAVAMVDAESNIDKAGYTDNGLTWSDFPVLEKAANGNDQYRIDISYVLSPALDEDINNKANVTQSSKKYFTGSFDLGKGLMTGSLGNNGRLSILAKDTLTAFEAVKEWKDSSDSDNRPDEISVDLIQVWTDPDGTEKQYTLYEDQKITADNNWKKTWTSLPKYAVTAGGEYILDKDNKPIEVSYTVQEKGSTAGWTSTGTPEAAKDKVVLTNTKTVANKLSLEKKWEDESYTALNNKENWAIEAQLYAGTDKDNMKPYDKAIVQEDTGYIWADLGEVHRQNDDSKGQAILTVHYGKDEKANDDRVSWVDTTVEVNIDPETGKITLPENQKTFAFESKEGWSIGQQGHNNYADKLKVEITLSNSTSDKMIKISDVKTTYSYGGKVFPLTMNPLKSKNVATDTSENLGVSGKGMNQYVMSYISGGLAATLNNANSWKQNWSADEISFPATDADGNPMYYQFRETAIIIDGERFTAADNGFITVKLGSKEYKYKVVNSAPTNTPTAEGVLAFDIKNQDDKVNKSVEKIWQGTLPEGIDESKLTATMQLEKKAENGEWKAVENVTNSVKLEAEKTDADSGKYKWFYEWENLDRYDDSGEDIEYRIIETDCTEGYKQLGEPKVSGNKTTITNAREGTTNITATKIWQDAGDTSKRPESIELHLMRAVKGETDDYKEFKVKTITANDCVVSQDNSKWQYIWKDIPLFDDNGESFVYKIIEKRIDSEVYKAPTYSEDDPMTVYNTLEPGTTSVHFEKKWIDGDQTQRPDITVQLQKKTSVDQWENVNGSVVIKSPDTSYTWENLAKFDDKGNKIQYRVVETAIGTGGAVQYEPLPTGGKAALSDENGTCVIKNKIADIGGSTRTVKVRKNWLGDQGKEDLRGDIQVQLYKDNKPVSEAEDGIKILKEDNNWSVSWDNLKQYDESTGKEIRYTVKELKCPEGYIEENSTTDPDGTIVLNNRLKAVAPEKVTFSGQKIWNDDAKKDERPGSVKVVLYRTVSGGTPEKVEEQTVTGANGWKFTFDKGYPKSDDNGKQYTYSVKEDGEAGGRIIYGNNQYKVSYTENNDSFTIENTLYSEYNPGKHPIKVTKVWEDDNDSQGKRPDSVKVTLLQNNTVQEEVTLTEKDALADDSRWSKEFSKTYPIYDENGSRYSYSVKEDAIEDYTLKSVTGNVTDGFVLTNTYAPGKLTVTVNKIWVDDGNKLNTRPENGRLELTLVRSDGHTQKVVVKAPSWSETVDVPAADENGKLYTYKVQESDAALEGTDYIKSEKGCTVTNTLSGKVSISGTKTWKDDDNKRKLRPGYIRVNLICDNKITDTVTVKAGKDGIWSYEFKNLPKYDENGRLLQYSVEEDPVKYYNASVEGYDIINILDGSVIPPDPDDPQDPNDPNSPQDPEKPGRTGEKDDPSEGVRTGDDMPAAGLGLVAVISAMGAAAALFVRRRHH